MAMKSQNNQKNSSKNIELFPILCIIIIILIIFFICASIGSIIIGGIVELPITLDSAEVQFAFRLSLVTATISSCIVMFLALPASYALTKIQVPFRNFFSILIELTLSLPFLLLGLCLLIVFSSPFGKFLKDLGFKVVFAPAGIVMAHIIVNLPYAIRLIKIAFNSVDRKTQLIAESLGASSFQFFYAILIPMCKSSVINAFLLVWSRAIGEFGATLMLVGITRFKTETLPGSIYLAISTGNNETAMAIAIIMLLISAFILLLTNAINHLFGKRGNTL